MEAVVFPVKITCWLLVSSVSYWVVVATACILITNGNMITINITGNTKHPSGMVIFAGRE